MKPRLKALAEAQMAFVRSFLPEEMDKDEKYLAQKRAGDFEDNLDAAYHEGFVDGYNQCLEGILKRLKEGVVMTESEVRRRIEETLEDLEKALKEIDAKLSAEERAVCEYLGVAPADLLKQLRQLGLR